jgi:hypothetical protein
MLDPTINAAMLSRLRTLQIISAALVLGVAIFAAIVATMAIAQQSAGAVSLSPPTNAPVDILRYVAGALVVTGCAIAVGLNVTAGRSGGTTNPGSESDGMADLSALFARFFMRRLTAYALLEGPALFGAVLVLLGGNFSDLAFVGVPLTLMLLMFPTTGKWENFAIRNGSR